MRTRLAVALAAVFFVIYVATLFGWLKSDAAWRWNTRVEPVVILAIGYYLGRLPGRQVEEVFGETLERQSQKADAAQHAKELALQAGEVLEERMKIAKMILAAARQTRGVTQSPREPGSDDALRQSVATALSILDS